jgi:hypothetical protein
MVEGCDFERAAVASGEWLYCIPFLCGNPIRNAGRMLRTTRSRAAKGRARSARCSMIESNLCGLP